MFVWSKLWFFSSSHVLIWELDHKEGWVLKNWCFQIVGWRRIESPLDSREINQLILKEINTEYSLEWLMLKLKLQYFGHLMGRADSLEETLILGKTEGKRRGQQRLRWFDSITNSMDMNLSKLQEMEKDREAWHAAVHGITKNWTWLGDWTNNNSVNNMFLMKLTDFVLLHSSPLWWKGHLFWC